MAYAVGHILGAHFNPAVSFGLWAAGRFEGKNLLGYVLAQLIGALVAAGTLFLILSGKPGFETVGGFASSGYGALSPGGFSMFSVLVAEFVLTVFFLFIILGSTSKDAPSKFAPSKFAPIAIGLGLTLIHLISIPISNTSVNPARSTSQAFFAGGDYPAQLWLFWLAPIAGAIVAGLIC
jgi:aquaporin Z